MIFLTILCLMCVLVIWGLLKVFYAVYLVHKPAMVFHIKNRFFRKMHINTKSARLRSTTFASRAVAETMKQKKWYLRNDTHAFYVRIKFQYILSSFRYTLWFLIRFTECELLRSCKFEVFRVFLWMNWIVWVFILSIPFHQFRKARDLS